MNNLNPWIASRSEWEKMLRTGLDALALENFDSALRGEPGAGSRLCIYTPAEYRGLICVFFYLHVRNQGFREFLSESWIFDHSEVIDVMSSRRQLKAVFKAARFELPETLPESVTLYRGTSYLPFSSAKRGYCWTTDKRIAAQFAMRFGEGDESENPLVLRATVPKSSILFYSDERGEKEALCFQVRGATVDGNIEQWQELSKEADAATPENERLIADKTHPNEDDVRAVFSYPLPQLWAAARARFDVGGLSLNSLHGPSHWADVEGHALRLALQVPGADPLVCRVFAIVHDMGRQDEWHDPEHGPRAATWLDTMRHVWLNFLTPVQFQLLRDAVAGHADGKTSSDPTIGVCWDSDRLDLPRVGITPRAALLSTHAARQITAETNRATSAKGELKLWQLK